MDKTRQVLASMLTQNTGTHFLDSGGAYGRNWERNQGRDFDSEKESTLTFKWGLEVTHNVYHWLAERVEYDEHMDKLFHRWADLAGNEGKHWLQLMSEFVKKRGGTGYYGSGEPVTVNTYNGENLLSQILQYVYWCDDDGEFILLQIHGGCDVRGGYTAPRVFRCNDECAIFDNARASIWCPECEANWSTDDAYHWYFEGACGWGAGKELQDFEIIKEEDWEEQEVDEREPREINPILGEKLGEITDLFTGETSDVQNVTEIKLLGIKGSVLVNEDGDGYCPCCGKGILYPSFY